MSTRARLQNANDSKSLWNYTLSPGWEPFDAHILRLAVMKYGCGCWKGINKHFPKKTCGQLNLQTQRLFGQQALAEFNKLHIDPTRIKVINDKIEGFRKNQCLINTGNNLTAQQRQIKKEAHQKKYGLSPQIYSKIEVPLVIDPPEPRETVVDDIETLRELYRCIYDIELRIKHLERIENGEDIKGATRNRSKSKSKSSSSNNKNVAMLLPTKPSSSYPSKPKQTTNTNTNAKVNEDKKDEEPQGSDIEMVDTNNGDNTDNKNGTNNDKNDKNDENGENDDIMSEEPISAPPPQPASNSFAMNDAMDEETALALAISASMAESGTNNKKQATTKKKTKSKASAKKSAKSKTKTKPKSSAKKSAKKKSKKKSAKKSAKKSSKKKTPSRKSKKRKNMDNDGDEVYVPPPSAKRVKR